MAVRAVKRAEVEHPHGMFKWVSSDCLSCNSISTIASLRKRLFVSVGSWWQLCYPNETLRERMARKEFTMFIVLILNLYQTTAAEMSSPSRPGQLWTPNVIFLLRSNLPVDDFDNFDLAQQIFLMDNDPVSALTDVMRVLASTPADFTALCIEVSLFYISFKLLVSIRCFVRRAFPFPFLIFNVSNVIINLLASTPCRLHCFLLEFSIF